MANRNGVPVIAEKATCTFPSLIEKKRDGGELSAEEIDFLVAEFTRGEIPDYQMSAWAMAVFFRGMTGTKRSISRAR